MEIMFYIHHNELDQSIQFYTALGFFLINDDFDGSGIRRARLAHPDARGLQIALDIRPELLSNSPAIFEMQHFPFRAAFTIVTIDYLDWKKKFTTIGSFPVFEVNEPWGTWIYYKDPSGNLLCIADNNLW